MSNIQIVWEVERLKYQQRYVEYCEKFKESQEKEFTEFSQGQYKGAMLEISQVLINIFGLSGGQVLEVERNRGFTDADMKSGINR